MVFNNGSFLVPKAWHEGLSHLSLNFVPQNKLEFNLNRTLEKEEYNLIIAPSIVFIESSSKFGKLNGLRTLKQLIAQIDEKEELHCLRIEDSPAIPIRSFLLDISHHRVPNFVRRKLQVEFLADQKFNQIQLGMQFGFDQELLYDAPYISPEEIQELDKFCESLGVELVLSLNPLAELHDYFRRERYQKLAENESEFFDTEEGEQERSSAIDITNAETLTFLTSLYEELLPLFSSSLVNLRATHFEEIGTGKSAELIQETGREQAVLQFLNKIIRLLKKYEKRAMLFDDFFVTCPELLKEIPKESIIIVASQDKSGNLISKNEYDQRCQVILQEGKTLYTSADTLAQNAILGRPQMAKERIDQAVSFGIKHEAEGVLLTDWGLKSHLNLLVASLLPIHTTSQYAWKGESIELEPLTHFIISIQFHLVEKSRNEKLKQYFAIARLIHDEGINTPISLFYAPLLDQFIPSLHEFYPIMAKLDWERILALLLDPKAEAFIFSSTFLGQELLGELFFGLRLFYLFVRLSSHFFQTENFLIEEIPAKEAKEFLDELEDVKEKYTLIWKRSYKSNGLEESLLYFDTLSERLKNTTEL